MIFYIRVVTFANKYTTYNKRFIVLFRYGGKLMKNNVQIKLSYNKALF